MINLGGGGGNTLFSMYLVKQATFTVAHKGHAVFVWFLDVYNKLFGCSVSVIQLNENPRNVSTAKPLYRGENVSMFHVSKSRVV